MKFHHGFTPYRFSPKGGKGFTLIEVMVVVIILIILSATVLVSLSGSKGRGNDTAVKADLGTVQVQATLYYGIANTYGATNTGASASCSATGTVFSDSGTTIDDIIGISIASATKNAKGNSVVCRSTSSAFLVAGQLSSGKYWCVDWTGTSTEETSQPGNTITACP